MNVSEELERLARLHTAGDLSDGEYERAKAHVLNRAPASAGRTATPAKRGRSAIGVFARRYWVLMLLPLAGVAGFLGTLVSISEVNGDVTVEGNVGGRFLVYDCNAEGPLGGRVPQVVEEDVFRRGFGQLPSGITVACDEELDFASQQSGQRAGIAAGLAVATVVSLVALVWWYRTWLLREVAAREGRT